MLQRNVVLATEAHRSDNPLLEAGEQFEAAARFLDLETWIVQRLRHPEREITANLLLHREGGAPLISTAYRVQHSTVLGPGLGPLTFSPDIDIAQLRASAMKQTWQSALLGLPFGGSCGAVTCPVRELSEHELEKLAGSYAVAMRDVVGAERDVITPDPSASLPFMSWLLDAHSQQSGTGLGAVTGKARALFGVEAGEIAGAAHLALAQHIHGAELSGCTVVIAGFGPAAIASFAALQKAGARVIALSDLSGAVYDAKGLDLASVRAYLQAQHVLFEYPEAEPLSSREALRVPCDILLLAGGGRQISEANAEEVRATMVIEASESAISPAAETVLAGRGMSVIPDLLGTAGRLLANFLEWRRNLRADYLSVEDLRETARGHIERTWRQAKEEAARHRFGLRQACHVIGIRTVAEALRLR